MHFAYAFKNRLKTWLRPAWNFAKTAPSKLTLIAARTGSRLFPKLFFVEPHLLYPPKNISKSTPAWVTSAGESFAACISEVDTACTIYNPLPKTIHTSIRAQFLIDEHFDWPATFVAKVPEGRVWGDGFVFTPDDCLLSDVSVDFRALTTKQPSPSRFWKLQRLAEIDGTVAVLSTDGGNLYYHWLFQLLPRLELMRRATIDLAEVDYFVVNSLDASFQRETLALLGIDQSRLIQSAKVEYLRARQLIVPSIPLGGGAFRPWMCDFVRRAFISNDPADIKIRGRRLYITRRQAGYRRVLNEMDVIERLRLRGFDVVSFEALTVIQQAATIGACEVVLAPHGGGMSNIVFCSPGTKVIELFSPELVATYFWKLCNQVGLEYYYLLGKGDPGTLAADYSQSWDARADIEVDLVALEQTLDFAGIN